MKSFLTAGAIVIGSVCAAQAATIEFEEFNTGDTVTSINAGGLTISVDTVSNDSDGGLGIIFDTNNFTGGDDDLQSPFADTNGLAANLIPNNVLIIDDAEGNGPDDEERGGTITFDFGQLVSFLGFTGLDNGTIVATTDDGSSLSTTVASDNEFDTVTSAGILTQTITFTLQSSGAIDAIVFEVPSEVPVPASGLLLLAGLGAFGAAKRRKRS